MFEKIKELLGKVNYDTVEYISFQYLDRESDEDEALRQEMLCALAWQIVCKVLKENDPCIDRILLGLEDFDIPESVEKARTKVVEYKMSPDGCYYSWNDHAPANSTRVAVAVVNKRIDPNIVNASDGRKFIFFLDKLREKYEKITASDTPVPSYHQATPTPQPKPESESKETAKDDSSPITKMLEQLEPDNLVDTFSNLSPEKRDKTLQGLIGEYNKAVSKELQKLIELTRWLQKVCNMADSFGRNTKQVARLLDGNAGIIEKLMGKVKSLPEDLNRSNNDPNGKQMFWLRNQITAAMGRHDDSENAEEKELLSRLIEAYKEARRCLNNRNTEAYEDAMDKVAYLKERIGECSSSSSNGKSDSDDPEDESGTPSNTEGNPEAKSDAPNDEREPEDDPKGKPKRLTVSAGDFIQFLEVVGVEEDKYPPYLKKTGRMPLTTMLTLPPLNKWCRENGYPEYPA